MFRTNLTRFLQRTESKCESEPDHKTYLFAIRRVYDERCFFYIDMAYDCGNFFINSLKTNVALEFKYSSAANTSVTQESYLSKDQLTDIYAVCNGTAMQDCLQQVKPVETCEGYALEKALNCSMNDYVYKPFKHFRCQEVLEIKPNRQCGTRIMFNSFLYTFSFLTLIFKANYIVIL